jgi:hypothetical protein
MPTKPMQNLMKRETQTGNSLVRYPTAEGELRHKEAYTEGRIWGMLQPEHGYNVNTGTFL